MEKIEVRVINSSNFPLPQYQTAHAAAVDLQAAIDEPIILESLERRVISTGLTISLPIGYEAQIRSRSGLALKHGISVANGVGTIDADYRGEVGVIVINLSPEAYTIQPGDRIAQMVVAKCEQIEWRVVTDLEETSRGDGGFGSTG
ncbi:MAG: dUTP diphosphatase [Microcoleus sp.]